MAFTLIPREEKFFELFEAQAAHNVEAARAFSGLISAWDPASPAFARLQDIEHEADIATHEIMDRLNRTFVTPLDREDIHGLASELDDIVDVVESVASRMQLYRIETVPEDAAQMAGILAEAAENVRRAVSCLRDLSNQRRLMDYCIEINRLENAGDRTLHAALGRLFAGKPDPIDVLKWKEIYEGIELAIDKCEDVAVTIEGIAVKHG